MSVAIASAVGLGGLDLRRPACLDATGRVALRTESGGRLVEHRDALERARPSGPRGGVPRRARRSNAVRTERNSPRTSAAALAARSPCGRSVPTASSAVERSLGEARSSSPARRPRAGRRRFAATTTNSSRNRAASASRLATRSASSSWPRSRSSERRRSASTAARPRARSRSRSTRDQPVAGVALPACRQFGLDRHHRVSRRANDDLSSLSRRRTRSGSAAATRALTRQRGDLPPGDERLQQVEFGDQRPVSLGGRRLTLQRAQLPPHLAEQVLHPQQVRLGGIEAALRLFLALAELEHAGRFLDDRPPLLGPGVETASIWPWLTITCC